jgi:3-hydroxybutyrate dehydrogenase
MPAVTDTMNALKPLAGRVAVVTGSTSGIGLGIAYSLASAGAALVINGLGDADAIDPTCPALPVNGGWTAQ